MMVRSIYSHTYSFIEEEDLSLNGEEVEKPVEVSSDDSQSEDNPEKAKLLKTLLFESSSVNPLWSD